MIIDHAIEPRIVDDYDITFANGTNFPITIDKTSGDTMAVEQEGSVHVIRFYLSAKPSPTHPSAKIPPEEITIFMPHVIRIEHRTHLVTPPTPEQRHEFQQTLHKLSPIIQ
jgi:hypothetical protein